MVSNVLMEDTSIGIRAIMTHFKLGLKPTETYCRIHKREVSVLVKTGLNLNLISDKIKQEFFVAVLVLLFGCTTWNLKEHLEKKLDGNYTRMLHTVLNKSGKQHTKLHSHLHPISQTIKVRQARYAWFCWRSKAGLVSDLLLWIPIQTHSLTSKNLHLSTLLRYWVISRSSLMEDRDRWQEGQGNLYGRYTLMMMIT